MRYDEMDLSALERAAWQRGDYAVQAVFAAALDAQAATAEIEAERYEWAAEESKRADDAESKLQSVAAVLDRLSDALSDVRMSKTARKDLESLIAEAGALCA